MLDRWLQTSALLRLSNVASLFFWRSALWLVGINCTTLLGPCVWSVRKNNTSTGRFYQTLLFPGLFPNLAPSPPKLRLPTSSIHGTHLLAPSIAKLRKGILGETLIWKWDRDKDLWLRRDEYNWEKTRSTFGEVSIGVVKRSSGQGPDWDQKKERRGLEVIEEDWRMRESYEILREERTWSILEEN